MASEDRRSSTILTANPFIEVTDTTMSPSATQPVMIDRTPSPTDELLPWQNSPKTHRHRTAPETQYAETEVEELLSMLRETESLEEQGDILQYLVSYRLIITHRTMFRNSYLRGRISRVNAILLFFYVFAGGLERIVLQHRRIGRGTSRSGERSAEESLREGLPTENVGYRTP